MTISRGVTVENRRSSFCRQTFDPFIVWLTLTYALLDDFCKVAPGIFMGQCVMESPLAKKDQQGWESVTKALFEECSKFAQSLELLHPPLIYSSKLPTYHTTWLAQHFYKNLNFRTMIQSFFFSITNTLVLKDSSLSAPSANLEALR